MASHLGRNAAAFGVAVLGVAAASCMAGEDDHAAPGAKSTAVQAQIMRVPKGKPLPHLRITDESTSPGDGAWAQSFTPTSIKISVAEISLDQGSIDEWDNVKPARIYECAGKETKDCLVEVSNLEDFEDSLKAKAVEVQPGTYTKLKVTACKGFGGKDDKQIVELTGSAELAGKSYVTDTAGGLKEGVVADATPVRFSFSGCAIQIPLAKPIVVAPSADAAATPSTGATPSKDARDPKANASRPKPKPLTIGVAVRLLFDARDFAVIAQAKNEITKALVAGSADQWESRKSGWFNKPDAPCAGNAEGVFVCTQRTSLVATDDPAPYVERYALSYAGDSARSANAKDDVTALVSMMFRSDGVPVQGFIRRSVQAGAAFAVPPLPGDGSFQRIKLASDKSLVLSQGPKQDLVTFAAFRREAHEGAMIPGYEGNDKARPTEARTYEAIKLD